MNTKANFYDFLERIVIFLSADGDDLSANGQAALEIAREGLAFDEEATPK